MLINILYQHIIINTLSLIMGCGQVVKAADSDSATVGSSPTTPAIEKTSPLGLLCYSQSFDCWACFFFLAPIEISEALLPAICVPLQAFLLAE